MTVITEVEKAVM